MAYKQHVMHALGQLLQTWHCSKKKSAHQEAVVLWIPALQVALSMPAGRH